MAMKFRRCETCGREYVSQSCPFCKNNVVPTPIPTVSILETPEPKDAHVDSLYDPNNAPGANISRGQAMMLPDDIKMYTKTEANRLRGVNWRSFDSATIPVKDKFILKKDIIEWFQKNYL